MIGSLLDHWVYAGPDIWSKLASVRKAPTDFFTELYRTAYDFLQNPPEYKEFEKAVNDPNYAKQGFEKIQADDFGNEASVVGLMEAAYKTIRDFEVKGYERLYKRLMSRFIEKYNLRYGIDDPFQLRVILPGVFAGLYRDLQRINQADEHLAELMHEFEVAFGNYARTKHAADLKTCIGKASNLAEGVATRACGENGTLGKLCDRLNCWPHAAVKSSLKCLYGFCSDYPGIRHGGKPESRIRDLETKDGIVICLLLFAFSGYLTNQVRADEVLGL